jgi:hypothetical protein
LESPALTNKHWVCPVCLWVDSNLAIRSN